MRKQAEILPTVTVVIDDDVDCVFTREHGGRLSHALFVGADQMDLLQLPSTVFSNVCRVGSAELEQVNLGTVRKANDVSRKIREELARTISTVGTIDQKIAQLMIEARVRLVFLINTLGGCIGAEEKLIGYAKMVRKNGGEVWAFGREDVSSAGAMIFMEADPNRRCLVEGSELFFHLSTGARKENATTVIDSQMALQRAEELKLLKELFRANGGMHSSGLEAQLDVADKKAALGDDVSLTFSAKEAERLMNIRRRSLNWARTEYEARLGGKKTADALLKIPESEPIRKFFS